ncbi:MAG TPA: DUF5916 domain-containing protein [Vicinamibacteria bacterium]|nr:DUF5916 domain-containing protein [Vicinamibacteria bacterium]
MSGHPRLLITIALGLIASAGSAADEERPRLEIRRAATPPVVDGVLDDEAWRGAALPLTRWLTYNPLSGEKLTQETEVRAAYDDRYIYFAFHCVDPEPGKVRSTISRRDNMFGDDWVGLSLDSVGNGQSSYDMFINPAGVQGDILTTPSSGEQSAPDWVWDSAGLRTDEGYDVEVRLPLTSIRFKSGPEVTMGVLFWRRVSRLGMSASWPVVPAGRSFLERHAVMVLRDLRRPLTLELAPSATYSRRQSRATPTTFGPAEQDPDAGLSVKYGVTSSATLEGTVNPDFSQVESDAFQVEVNQRFPLFFSEKRPFFMEGMGSFEMAGAGGDAVMRTAVHTRRIADPVWGLKTTGTAGRVGFGILAAGDQAPGRQPLGGPANPFLGKRRDFYVARSQLSLGRSSYLGGLLTDTEFGAGHNRVGGADVSLRFGNHGTSATFLATRTASPDGRDEKDGLGGQATYYYDSRRVVFITQLEHYDRGFQMDTAFLNQVGITQGWSFLAPSFYPDAKKHPWFKRFVPFVFAQYGHDRLQGGRPWVVVPGLRMHFTRQGFFRVDGAFGQEPWAGRTFDTRSIRVQGEAQFTRWLHLSGRSTFGRSIFYDAVDPFLGRSRTHYVALSLQPTARLNQTVVLNRVEFDRLEDGARVYTVNVLNTRTTFQLDRHFFLRAIVQYDSSREQVLTDLLASWELLPGTVAYAGYGSLIERQDWDGTRFLPAAGVYRTSQRGLFFKASYVYRF